MPSIDDLPPWDAQPFQAKWLREKKLREDQEWQELLHEAYRMLQGYPYELRERVMRVLERGREAGVSPSHARVDFAQAMRLIQSTSPRTAPVFKDPDRFVIKTPTMTRSPIEPLPEFFCLHFIGGPKSGTEEYWPYKENAKLIEQGKNFQVRMPSTEQPTIDENNTVHIPQAEAYSYRTTFIPRHETPFSDAQVVICLFQG